MLMVSVGGREEGEYMQLSPTGRAVDALMDDSDSDNVLPAQTI